MKISGSILSIKDDIENIKLLDNADIDYLHLDIMDGIFVKQKVDMNIKYTKPLDIHLMVDDVIGYIDKYKVLNPEYITFHLEINHDIMEIIKYINTLNIKVGIAIKPETKVSDLIPYLPFIDLVLLMSVEPGSGGQDYINVESKIDELNKLKGNYKISVDGGINDVTIKTICKADIAVVGSFITSGDYIKNIKKLKESIYG